MSIQKITSRFDGRTLYESEAETLMEALVVGVKQGADLQGADLQGVKLNWQSHALLGEILKQAASDDVQRRCLAGGIAISLDWCWDKMLRIEHPEKEWALTELVKWVQDGDDTPKVLVKLAEQEKGAKA